MKDFEALEHTADLKIRAYGATLQELFINALKGMFQSIQPKAPSCMYKNDRLICSALPQKRTVDISSSELDLLLVDFLSEALYLSDTFNEAYLDATIEYFNNQQIKAILMGVHIEGFEVVEIKAVTYHDLTIKNIQGIWQADIVFDI